MDRKVRCRLFYLFNNLCRVAADYHIVWHILCCYSPCGNDGISANGYARTDDGTVAILTSGPIRTLSSITTFPGESMVAGTILPADSC